jgi:hypothetical protein
MKQVYFLLLSVLLLQGCKVASSSKKNQPGGGKELVMKIVA